MTSKLIYSSIFFAFALLCGISSSQGREPPSDGALILMFQTHRAELEKLHEMMAERPPGVALLSESDIPTKLRTALGNEYKSLLNMWPGLVVGANYDGSVRFIFDSDGTAIGPGWAKGIDFVPDGAKTMGTQKDELDDALNRPEGVYQRRLAPRWFLFFQRDN